MTDPIPGTPRFVERLLADRIGLDVASVGVALVERGVRARMDRLGVRRREDYERVDERITAHAMGPALKLAMRALPSEQRRALELRVIEQLDYEEVAGRLGCSQNAARLRVSRGLRALTLSIRGAEA